MSKTPQEIRQAQKDIDQGIITLDRGIQSLRLSPTADFLTYSSGDWLKRTRRDIIKARTIIEDANNRANNLPSIIKQALGHLAAPENNPELTEDEKQLLVEAQDYPALLRLAKRFASELIVDEDGLKRMKNSEKTFRLQRDLANNAMSALQNAESIQKRARELSLRRYP